jgi:hypothetical protein
MSSAMRAATALLCSLTVLASGGLCPSTASASQSPPDLNDRIRATDKALRWLSAHQNTDGGFGDPVSDPQATCEVVLAFAWAYEEPGSVRVGGKSPLDYLASQVVTQTNSAQGTAVLILAVVAGNRNPEHFGSADLTSSLHDQYDDLSGRYYAALSDGIAAQALAMMAEKAAWYTIPPEAVAWLKGQQNIDGGWGPLPGEPSDTENTALSIQALIAAGETPGSQPLHDAIAYLHERQAEDAGFASSAAVFVSDPASTSQAIQALLAAGENLLSDKWRRCLNTPFDALLDTQEGDGCFEDDPQITAAAVPGVMGRFRPLPGRYLASLKALEWLSTRQLDDGGFGNGGFTADAVYAIGLCGQDPAASDWTKNEVSALDALEAETPAYIVSGPADPPGSQPAGELGKVIRAVAQAGGDPHEFAEMDLVEQLIDTYQPSTGRYHPSKIYSHDLALIALQAVTETIPSLALTKLEEAQVPSGGWPWAWGATTADVDSTGLSMQAIVAAGGPSSSAITDNGTDFLDSLRFPSGGYPDLASRAEPNCDSTSLAIQGLLASGRYRQEPLLFALETGAVSSSWDALLAFQEPSGSFVASASVPESRLLATVEAIHALASPHYPAYQPLAEGDATVTGTAHGRLTCGSGLEIVAPYSGDDDSDGTASLLYRAVGEFDWNGPTGMVKGGLSYLKLLNLQAGTEYEFAVTYQDPDGVSDKPTQSLSLYLGKACIPVVFRSHGG